MEPFALIAIIILVILFLRRLPSKGKAGEKRVASILNTCSETLSTRIRDTSWH